MSIVACTRRRAIDRSNATNEPFAVVRRSTTNMWTRRTHRMLTRFVRCSSMITWRRCSARWERPTCSPLISFGNVDDEPHRIDFSLRLFFSARQRNAARSQWLRWWRWEIFGILPSVSDAFEFSTEPTSTTCLGRVMHQWNEVEHRWITATIAIQWPNSTTRKIAAVSQKTDRSSVNTDVTMHDVLI
jgi:hypothetical protein